MKISLIFAEYKLVMPWTVLYDSKKGVALTEIKLKFYHDDFQVHRLDYETTFNIFVDHQLVRGQLPPVSLVYEWQALQEDDLGAGVFAMFTLTLFATIAMIVFISYSMGKGGSRVAILGGYSNSKGTTGGSKGKSSFGDFISSSNGRKQT